MPEKDRKGGIDIKKETLLNYLKEIDEFRKKEIDRYKGGSVKSMYLWGYLSDEEYETTKKFFCELADCKGIDVKTMIKIFEELKDVLEYLAKSEQIF